MDKISFKIDSTTIFIQSLFFKFLFKSSKYNIFENLSFLKAF